ncbi:hypothetical protein WN944_024550 [Citrus x changshan-huyou]|uniref:Uncharacterized protein n=1 Tax=Citrus x changshan-huyou TaxID=2935761 RepID=A0AAP0QAR6_9ROSI
MDLQIRSGRRPAKQMAGNDGDEVTNQKKKKKKRLGENKKRSSFGNEANGCN